jgi:hypothetical protein
MNEDPTRFFEELTEGKRALIELFEQTMNQVRADSNKPIPDLGFAILLGSEVRACSFFVCSLWMSKYPFATRIGLDQIGPYEVSTIFSCAPVGWTRGDKKRAQHFETLVWRNGNEWWKTRHEHYVVAKQQHRKILEELRERYEREKRCITTTPAARALCSRSCRPSGPTTGSDEGEGRYEK